MARGAKLADISTLMARPAVIPQRSTYSAPKRRRPAHPPVEIAEPVAPSTHNYLWRLADLMVSIAEGTATEAEEGEWRTYVLLAPPVWRDRLLKHLGEARAMVEASNE